MNPWSLERPTEPGLYLFFGELKGYVPARFVLVEVREAPDGLEYVTGSQFLYPEELNGGAFRPFDEKPPDRSALSLVLRAP